MMILDKYVFPFGRNPLTHKLKVDVLTFLIFWFFSWLLIELLFVYFIVTPPVQYLFFSFNILLFIPGIILAVKARCIKSVIFVATFSLIIHLLTINFIPFKLAYYLSKPSFDNISEKVIKEEKIKFPITALIFKIEKAEIESTYKGRKAVCLWTDLNPGGYHGFINTTEDDIPFALWGLINLDNDWQYIEIE